jgi:ketopantoate hydroxymethyltransferase
MMGFVRRKEVSKWYSVQDFKMRFCLSGDSDHVFRQITAGTMKVRLEKHTQHTRQIARATGNIQDMLVFDTIFFHCVFNYANINVDEAIAQMITMHAG